MIIQERESRQEPRYLCTSPYKDQMDAFCFYTMKDSVFRLRLQTTEEASLVCNIHRHIDSMYVFKSGFVYTSQSSLYYTDILEQKEKLIQENVLNIKFIGYKKNKNESESLLILDQDKVFEIKKDLTYHPYSVEVYPSSNLIDACILNSGLLAFVTNFGIVRENGKVILEKLGIKKIICHDNILYYIVSDAHMLFSYIIESEEEALVLSCACMDIAIINSRSLFFSSPDFSLITISEIILFHPEVKHNISMCSALIITDTIFHHVIESVYISSLSSDTNRPYHYKQQDRGPNKDSRNTLLIYDLEPGEFYVVRLHNPVYTYEFVFETLSNCENPFAHFHEKLNMYDISFLQEETLNNILDKRDPDNFYKCTVIGLGIRQDYYVKGDDIGKKSTQYRLTNTFYKISEESILNMKDDLILKKSQCIFIGPNDEYKIYFSNQNNQLMISKNNIV